MMRQRSNTLPKSFGSQLEKEEEKKQDVSDKSATPAVEATLESIQKKLQEKRTESNRPEDIKVQLKGWIDLHHNEEHVIFKSSFPICYLCILEQRHL